jgi:hypothetical protein
MNARSQNTNDNSIQIAKANTVFVGGGGGGEDNKTTTKQWRYQSARARVPTDADMKPLQRTNERANEKDRKNSQLETAVNNLCR